MDAQLPQTNTAAPCAAVWHGMQRTTTGVLLRHLAWLRTSDCYPAIAYGEGGLLAVTRTQAAALCEQTLRRRNNMALADLLRHHAEYCDSPRDDDFANLASWVGADTAAWHEVFSWGATDPWFQHLDDAGQRTALLLVAEILDPTQ